MGVTPKRLTRPSATQPPSQLVGEHRNVSGRRDEEEEESKEPPESGEDGKKDAKISYLFCHESGQGRRKYEQNGNDGINDCNLLDRQAQGLHVQVQVRI